MPRVICTLRALLMGSYVVLARKWRPSQFSDIGGQGPVVRTLMNAIQSDRIHHAYLLTGSRGIGKTSIARIFAKTIRCPNAQWDGTWLKNCDECSSCKEISAGNSVDVIEIDGASNNGVDAVREIRENAKFLPSSGDRKIYIIDEVHMLTTAAFNALLKTLEEPPSHVIFILATTEPHKIPGTILSRCQRFDLKRFTPSQVQTRLEEVSKAEGIDIENGALALLSRAADGSMRDALSLFDQVIAYAGNSITAASVRESIGLIESQSLLGILRGIFTRDAKSAIQIVDETYRAGHDLRLLAKNLLEYLHAAILLRIGMDSESLELSAEEREELRSIAFNREIEEIELFFQAFQNGTEWIARSPQPKLVLEVLIVKCALAEALVSISGGGSAPAQTPGNSGKGGSHQTRPSPQTAPSVSSQASHSTEPNPIKPQSATRLVTEAPLPKASLLFAGSAPAALKKTAMERATPDSSTTPASAPIGKGVDGPRSYDRFISFVRKSRAAMANALENAVCESFPEKEGDEFIVVFSPQNASVYQALLSSLPAITEMQKLTYEYFGATKRLIIEVKDTGTLSIAERKERDRTDQEQYAKNAVLNHPVIAEARALFGGDLGPIELTPQNQDTGKEHRP
jgi:DNA polymerase-3 subunit gamma/tau